MKINITNTDQLAELDGVLVRVWEGVTESGIPCQVFVHRIGVELDQDHAQFEKELQEQPEPMQALLSKVPVDPELARRISGTGPEIATVSPVSPPSDEDPF